MTISYCYASFFFSSVVENVSVDEADSVSYPRSVVSSDRSSCSVNVLVHIRQQPLFEISSISANIFSFSFC